METLGPCLLPVMCSEGEEGVQWSRKVGEKGQEVYRRQVEVGWVGRFPKRLEMREIRKKFKHVSHYFATVEK